jgi:hypothetical protein
MQTFVPHGPSFLATAMCLDNKRLGKQRVECLQIVNALTDPNAKGWRNHPATRMWDGHVPALVHYGLAMCKVWTNKGFKDTCADKMLRRAEEAGIDLAYPVLPDWLFDTDVIFSHRSNLIRKLPDHYGPMWPNVRDDMPYKWPV